MLDFAAQAFGFGSRLTPRGDFLIELSDREGLGDKRHRDRGRGQAAAERNRRPAQEPCAAGIMEPSAIGIERQIAALVAADLSSFRRDAGMRKSAEQGAEVLPRDQQQDRKSTRLNSS